MFWTRTSKNSKLPAEQDDRQPVVWKDDPRADIHKKQFSFHISSAYDTPAGVGVYGIVRKGGIKVGDTVRVISGERICTTTIKSISIFCRNNSSVSYGDEACLELRGIRAEEILPGAKAVVFKIKTE